MSKLNIAGSIVTLLAAIAPIHAQNSANGPGDFMLERILPLSGVVAPAPPSLPDAVLAGIDTQGHYSSSTSLRLWMAFSWSKMGTADTWNARQKTHRIVSLHGRETTQKGLQRLAVEDVALSQFMTISFPTRFSQLSIV